MSGPTRHATRLLRQVHPQYFQHHRLSSLTPNRPITNHNHHNLLQQQQQQQHRNLSLTPRHLNSNSIHNTNASLTPDSKPSVEQPPTTVEPPKISVEQPIPDLNENVKSIDQVISELNQDARTSQSTIHLSETESLSSSTTLSTDSTFVTEGSVPPPPPSASSQYGSGSDFAHSEGGASGSGSIPPPPPKRPSRFWFYLYHIMYWSALGSIPVHLLMIKGEAKDLKDKQEWKIGVLTDMKDKLKRNESVEEEEALLSVGMDRSKREEQVDEKYFEDLLSSAEKMDFVFGKDKDVVSTTETAATAPTAPTPAPAPAQPVVPRKPAPPKSERSYL